MSVVSVVVSICHIITPIQDPICHEEVVWREEMPMIVCQMSQPAIAEWKENSAFKGEDYRIEGFKCVSGNYVPKTVI